jgi:hypothetical protein
MALMDSNCPGLLPRDPEKPVSQHEQDMADHVTVDALSQRYTPGNLEDSAMGEAND